jgi:hypothetical protein
LGPILVVLAAIWCPIGCWIARHETNARRRGRSYVSEPPTDINPTNLAIGNLKSLFLCLPTVLILTAICCLPILAAGGINSAMGGPGAILVALLLPVVLIGNLLMLCLAIGFVTWPLMPVTIGVERSDVFDALSRAYNYSTQRPIQFVVLMSFAVALSALPLTGVLYVVGGPIANWPAVAGHAAVWIAAGLSVAIFWSVQTIVYLHLRTSVDQTDANEAAANEQPVAKLTTAEVATGNAAASSQWLTALVKSVVITAGTWFATVWLLLRIAGDDANWIAWGFGDRFVPDVQGMYWVAALIGGFWGAILLAAPFLVAMRGRLRGATMSLDPSKEGQDQQASSGHTGICD